METSDYFTSYADLDVHRLMLQDGPRNQAYRQAIFDNQSNIIGKVVLDVGAGTGILSIFCAQAGAKKVYAVEASDIFKIAEEIVKENNYENIIQVINSKVENVTLPEKVDVIVSEWMGFYLLHEAMLNSVIIARDKFLKSGGILFPESATLYTAPCSVPDSFEFWDAVDGISMKTFAKKLRLQDSKKPVMKIVKSEHILTDPEVLLWLDLREITKDDLKDIKLQQLTVANKVGKYQGICLWFTCNFPASTTEPVTLSTEPDEPETHWKQTVIVLPTEIDVEEGSPIAYELSLTPSDETERHYKIEVTLLDPSEVEHPEYCQCHLTKCILVRAVLENYEKNDLSK